jgi:hypothetical protein
MVVCWLVLCGLVRVHVCPVRALCTDEKKREKRHWRDYFDAPIELSEEMRAAKKMKVEGGDAKEVKFEDIAARAVDKVGSADPVGDFKAMLLRRDDPKYAAKALAEMAVLIKQFVTDSVGTAPLCSCARSRARALVCCAVLCLARDRPLTRSPSLVCRTGSSHFGKAMECLQAYRVGCVQEEEPRLFNDFLMGLQAEAIKKAGSRMEAFWKTVIAVAVLPIDNSEAADSKFTPDAARKFHSGGAPAASASASASVSVSGSDDLLNDLA